MNAEEIVKVARRINIVNSWSYYAKGAMHCSGCDASSYSTISIEHLSTCPFRRLKDVLDE